MMAAGGMMAAGCCCCCCDTSALSYMDQKAILSINVSADERCCFTRTSSNLAWLMTFGNPPDMRMQRSC